MLNRFGHWWIAANLLLSAGDIVTTLIAGVENEMNPIVIYYLTCWGAWSFVAAKLMCLACFMLTWRFFELFPQPARRVPQASIVIVSAGLQAAVVTNNLYWLLR